MAHVFTFTNAKGGCGKTTVALNLAVCFAKAGYRTLVVDLDQQGNLSASLGVNLDKLIRKQVEDFFGQSLVLESIIHCYVGVAEATAMKKGVVESPVAGSATFDFMKLFNELKREMKNEQKNQGTVESMHR